MKILIIRFSSIGDLSQSLSLPSKIREKDPNAEIHFLTRADFAEITAPHLYIQKCWYLNRESGISGLFLLASQLASQNFTHIYDAHNNLRSNILTTLIGLKNILKLRPKILRKDHQRLKRFLLIHLHKNFFEKPFSGQRDLIRPLQKWGYTKDLPEAPQLFSNKEEDQKIQTLLFNSKIQNFVVLVPSAAYELKRWPLENFQKLAAKNPNIQFIVLAGANDNFAKSISGPNVTNLTGVLDFGSTLSLLKLARATIANDTGLMHFSEQLGRPTIALMGPAPFGFPSRPKTKIMEIDLSCRPCSKHGQGPCKNVEFQKCLRDITVEQVHRELQGILGS